MNAEELLAMHMTSETATQSSPSRRPERASASDRATWRVFNVELLAALAACLAFWVLLALSVYWLV